MEIDIPTDDDIVVVNGPITSTDMSGMISRTQDGGMQASQEDFDNDEMSVSGSDRRSVGDSCDGRGDDIDVTIQVEGGGEERTDRCSPEKMTLQSSGVGILTLPAELNNTSVEGIDEHHRLKGNKFTVQGLRPYQEIHPEQQEQKGEQQPEQEQHHEGDSSSFLEKTDVVQKQLRQDCNLNIDMATGTGACGRGLHESVVAPRIEPPACAEATLCHIYANLQAGEEMLKMVDTTLLYCPDETRECDDRSNDGSRSSGNFDKSERHEAPNDLVAFQREILHLVALLSEQLQQEDLLTKGDTLHKLRFLQEKCSSLLDTFPKNVEAKNDCCSIDCNERSTRGDDLLPRIQTLARVFDNRPDQNVLVDEGYFFMQSDDGITEKGYLLSRVQELSGAVYKLLHNLRPVDLDKLIDLLQANFDVGDAIADRDVLLLLGSTGSGKTTTLHFLAGSSFEEVEVDGFDHLRPVIVGQECLSSFATSHSTRSVTRTMQSVDVCLNNGSDDRRIVLCDSPGFEDTGGVEMDIANGLGLVRSIRRAKSVKPILVLSKDGVGDRFEGVSRVLSIVARLVGSSTEEEPELSPFDYVFTKYDDKYATRLHKQFRVKRKEMSSSERANKALVAFVDDIISKTQPLARIVAPLDNPDHDRLLRNLMDGSSTRIKDPAKVFVPFVSEMAQDKLQLQLRMTLEKSEKALRAGDIMSTLYTLQQLKTLAAVLPEAQEYASSATSLCQYFIREKLSSFEMSIERCLLLRASKDAFSSELMSSKRYVTTILPLEPLRADCLPSLDSGIDFCQETLLCLARKLCREIVDAYEKGRSFQETISQCEQYVEAIDRTKDVYEMFAEIIPSSLNDDGGIKALYQRACEMLAYLIEQLVTQAEGHLDIFPETPLAEFASENRCLNYLLCELMKRHGALFKLGGFESRREKILITFEENLKQCIEKSQENLEKCKNASSLSQVLHVDVRAAELAFAVLDGLKLCPGLVEVLPSIDMENLKDRAKTFEDTVVDYLQLLSDSYESQYESIRRSPETDCASMDILVHAAPELMSVFGHLRGQSLAIVKQSEPPYRKVTHINAVFGNYLANLDVEPTEEKQNAVSEAKRLLRNLKEAGCVLVVPNIADAWEKWSEILTLSQQKPKAGKLKQFFIATMTWAGLGSANDAPTEEDTMVSNLSDLCVQIIRQIGSKVEHSLVCLESIAWNSCESTHFFRDHVNDVWTLTILIALHVKQNDLAKSVLAAFHHENWCSRAVRPLVSFFRHLSSTWTNHLNRGLFEQVKMSLATMRDAADFWSHCSDFSNLVLKVNNDTDLLELRESILACKTYEVLRDETMSRLLHIRSNTCDVSFLHNHFANSMNESDRNGFYQEISRSYEATREVHHLKDHIDPQVVDTASMRKEACKHLRSETGLLSKEIHHQLENFPYNENGHCRLYLLYCSLQCIEGCLPEAAPDIAGFAACLLGEVEGVLNRRLKSILINDSDTNDCDTILPLLLTLKKASMEMVCWRKELNALIDQLLHKSSTKASSSGRYLLRLKSELEEVKGADRLTAQQLLCEHDCFRGAMNAIFNAATARQDIDYVIKGLTLPKQLQIILKTIYKDFLDEYERLVMEGLTAMSCEEEHSTVSFFGDLARAAMEISQDYSLDYRTQLTDLTAHVFAYWSLKNTNAFVRESASGNFENEAATVNEYLMIPHAAQVVAIWTLLNYQNKDYLMLKNHLIQILTGEGKSVVLGVTSTVLSLMGCEVECICYSSYLSSRDFSAFENLFKDFDVVKYISYGTFEDLCNRIVGEGGDSRDLARNLVLRKGKKKGDAKYRQRKDRSRARVLLIDEVDVFFKRDFYGHTFNPAAQVRHESISALMRYIWKNRADLDQQSLMQREEVTNCLRIFPQEMQHLISHEISSMLHDSYHAETKPYSVVDGKVGYKDMDGLTFTTFYGYRTCFAYMLEYDKGNTTLHQMNKNLYIRLNCGSVSYAEIPSMFDFILGVTGSLQGLSEKELNILRDCYDINSLTFLPSVYGNNKLSFAKDCPRDVILCNTKSDHFMEIRNEISNRQKPEKENGIPRPVMVFFSSSETLLECYNSDQMKDLKAHTRTITEDIRAQDKEGAFLQAALSGAVTFLIREYGRGTDFKCFDERVVDSGGVHVIQTFFSSELSEEVQIKGRTARQGTRGSYSMVLSGEDLSNEFDLTMDDVQAMRDGSSFCSFLGPVREKKYIKECADREENVKEIEKLHYETLNYKEDLLDGNEGKAIAFLYKQHGLEHATSSDYKLFSSNRHTKATFLNARQKRCKEQEFNERFLRRAAQEEHENQDVPKLESASERTFYDLLGVNCRASNREIQQAFRKMSRKYHPDKCKISGSTERFAEVNEAKEVLLCPKQRAEYDQLLETKRGKGGTHN